MFPCIIGNDNVGSYRVAFEYSLRNFGSKDPAEMAKNSGSTFDSESSTIILNSLGQGINVKFPEGIVTFRNTSHLPVWYWRLVILNYLYRADKRMKKSAVLRIFYLTLAPTVIFILKT